MRLQIRCTSLYLEEERGYLQNPEVEKLKKKARKQLKQEEGLRTLRHMSAQQKTQDDLVNMQREHMVMHSRSGQLRCL